MAVSESTCSLVALKMGTVSGTDSCFSTQSTSATGCSSVADTVRLSARVIKLFDVRLSKHIDVRMPEQVRKNYRVKVSAQVRK
jgi:hypothetical protein